MGFSFFPNMFKAYFMLATWTNVYSNSGVHPIALPMYPSCFSMKKLPKKIDIMTMLFQLAHEVIVGKWTACRDGLLSRLL